MTRDVVFSYSRSQLVLCLLTAVVVGLTAYICAWLSFRGAFSPHEQYSTRRLMKFLKPQIESYRTKTGHLPATLSELDLDKFLFFKNEAGEPLDAWSRPFHYDVKDGRYDLYSLGRDNLPGGYGPDADLHADGDDGRDAELTLQQFNEALGTERIKFICILAGIAAFPLCLLGVRKSVLQRASPAKTFLRYFVTAVFAVFMALVIGMLHLPGVGH